ncbi:MAG TPA: DnaJ domain-containing protein [Actinophytocola sp.]|uniref:DnaJ domain-containing protein n=1 Tax=Actinophytocola sp. TaxID=1872138 RepID=UPI002DDD08F5|nr:DnaJ domain-containing protein [Actinophytocola sp.]HEV2778352.1 DnaJ domain-containing protein [Actinophytocola sp.]
MATTDYYAVLGVASTASPLEISRAYRRLVRRYHPDAQDAGARPDRLQEVITAYKVLRDPAQRADYDRRREPPPPRQAARRARPRDTEPMIRVGPVRYHGPARSF